jgi:CheY-like chemotaxis protein
MKAIRILLMEDDPLIGQLVAELLEGAGYEVCATAPTEAEAIAVAHEHRPDLIIADARLGTGSGIAAVEEILHYRFVPHLFITGDVARVKARKPEAMVLEKPFREADLMRAVRQVLDIAALAERT